MDTLLQLYRKSNGGHKMLSDVEFAEYAELRKNEFKDRRTELIDEGKTNVKSCKDDAGDIIGWTFEDSEPTEGTETI